MFFDKLTLLQHWYYNIVDDNLDYRSCWIIDNEKSISGTRWNAAIDTFVDNLVVTDDGDNVYVLFLMVCMVW